MGAALIPLLLPGLVAAACGYVIFVGLGNWGGLEATKLSVPDLPHYDGTTISDLLIAVGVGIVGRRDHRRGAPARDGRRWRCARGASEWRPC